MKLIVAEDEKELAKALKRILKKIIRIRVKLYKRKVLCNNKFVNVTTPFKIFILLHF